MDPAHRGAGVGPRSSGEAVPLPLPGRAGVAGLLGTAAGDEAPP
ncbi:MAG: CRISPR-associated protein Cas5 [Actinomycetota bacterium]